MSAQDGSHFKVVQKFTSDFSPTDFALYESQRTGMRVVVVDQKGPKVYGYFALATEIHDDSGAPHTLEHLVFMGSKSYQYKGLLDKLATRAYSNTNAWTATDHTAYTLETAGWEGFAQILPIYLEHVLLPTLTDAGCYTEVHHISPSGEDAGVVYSEMQGVQNSPAELMDLRARRLIYPKAVGYRYETGGLMEALRVLTADQIREFHRAMYQPKNLNVIVIGDVDHPNLLETLDKFESNIKEDVPRLDEPFKRPWVSTGKTPALEKSIQDIVEFPEEDESMGEILIGYFGPDINDDLENAAMAVFLTYICGSSISLLENVLVETEQLASGVYYQTESRPDVFIWFSLTGVETEKLESVEKRFYEVLKDAASKPFDMSYMRDCLQRSKRQLKFSAEGSANYFAEPIIEDHLFGERDGTTLLKLGSLKEYDDLDYWDEERWKTFFEKFFTSANHISILGRPSSKLSQKLKTDESARVEDQKKRLGEDGLKELAKKLAAAKEENEREIPEEVLKRFKVPGTDSIHFIDTTTARSGHAKDLGKLDNKIQELIDRDQSDLQTFIHFEHIPTNFVHVHVLVNTQMIPIRLRPLLSIYVDNFFNTPVLRNGQRIEFEDVVMQLEKETVSYQINSGFGSNPEVLQIEFKIEPEKYEVTVGWIRDLLYNSIFDVSRLKASLAKLLADVPSAKRSGSGMVNAVDNLLHVTQNSSKRAQNDLVKAVYLRRTLVRLEEDAEAVIDNFKSIQNLLGNLANIRVAVFANLESGLLKNPASAWDKLASSNRDKQFAMNPLDSYKTCLSDAGKHPGKFAYIIPMSTIDSSFAHLTARGPNSYEDPALPALAVALAYLDVTEGPMWNGVRGAGLAYGTFFHRDMSLGLLEFDIYRSPDAFEAYNASKTVIEDLATGKVPLETTALEGAVSSIVVGLADQQPTMTSAATVGFVNQVIKGIPKDWGVTFLKKVRQVGPEDIKQILKNVVLPIFQPSTANVVITCAQIMEEKMLENFTKAGFTMESHPLAYFQDDYGLEGPEVESLEEEDEDEEDEDDEDEDDEE